MSYFTEKVAIVTGSGKGIGKSIAKALLRKGSKVCVTDVNTSDIEKTKEEFEKEFDNKCMLFQPCDVKDEQQLKSVFENVITKFKKIDILVNNAAVIDELNWQTCIDTNLKGMMCGSYLALEYMRKDKGGNGGTIFNMSSGAGLGPCSYMPAYSASKHGVVGFTRSWALCPVAQSNNIRFLCMCPSFVETDMLSPDFVYDENRMKTLQKQKEKLLPDEVAESVLQMLADPNNPEIVAHISKENGLIYIPIPT